MENQLTKAQEVAIWLTNASEEELQETANILHLLGGKVSLNDEEFDEIEANQNIIEPADGNPPSCPQGYVWSSSQGKCIPDVG